MFNWIGYLELAQRLLGSPETVVAALGEREPPPLPRLAEAAWRAAASRAYYAAFHKCRETVEQRDGTPISGPMIHAEVLNRLRQRPETEAIARDVSRLRGLRAHADYNSALTFGVSNAQLAVVLATEVIRLLP